MDKLSIVVPCYNEEESIPLFFPAVEKATKKLDELQVEYWFVNDGSSDDTLNELHKLHNNYPEKAHYVSFSRNFGKGQQLVTTSLLWMLICKIRQNFYLKCIN